MGAVVYVGPNVQGGPDNCAWIMAWSTPGDGTENKIYVETGPSTKYPSGSIDWDTIKSSCKTQAMKVIILTKTARLRFSSNC
ncbi:uncharacterized protein LOC125498413 [Beta vulgaris subsp. vulgaris]|uniref:uncharacterized protein LOC125498413 n=1 Tax=Beta vulgaris subsp. vulgaris TaxID=3555 RepID=UPI00254687FE|nr:uncharacterized protein LOC125498413 [Beta vulgaris subsp. vulgaris]